ncbi:hypothetical protein, partial [Klebsiella pneumoniae]|uniref:hypothetical protein n=2 Tax=Klebsiella pneumoniae TaxID=573 RepID=UPI001D01A2D7
VHTVHLLIFLFNIIVIDGERLVKSEQSTLHLSAFLACFRRPSPQYDGDEGGGKKFFLGLTVHTVHLWFFINIFIVIQGEHTVKGEQWIVHP